MSLFDFFDMEDKRRATCEEMLFVFRESENKDRYDEWKYHKISLDDLNFYEKTLPNDVFCDLLAIASLNWNGYVREKAVQMLSQTGKPESIPFILYRLSDWVKPVRLAAAQGIVNFLSYSFLDAFVDNLQIIERLKIVERADLTEIYVRIIDFIVRENREWVLKSFRSYPEKTRIILAKHLVNTAVKESNAEVNIFLQDKSFMIRLHVIDYIDSSNSGIIERLIHDKSQRVRIQTLYKLNELKDVRDFENILEHFIADSSATARCYARFSLKEKIPDFSVVYADKLRHGKQLVGSLLGLAELNADAYSGEVKKFLYDEKIRVRKAAFFALSRLDEESAYLYALNHLGSEFPGIRKIAIDFLARNPRHETLEKAREYFKTGSYDLKCSMLHLFFKIGGWATLSDLMRGTLSPEEEIRQASFDYLQQWKINATRLCFSPEKESLDRIRAIFNEIHGIHEEKRYFQKNPLDGLDFYFE
ncbi:hypothetical protein FACS1894158_09130 [Betaproteobacteria bacterium]|nr:hypothetical protein FACS1894158_09130 [Betaproteobacteria bacterium]